MQASPSKARAQALASHSWSLVQAWLARLYHPSPVPAFERNAATLRALQSLMAENVAADRVRELLFEAKAEELAAGEEQEAAAAAAAMKGGENGHGAAIAILSSLETSLAPSARMALDSLASSVVLLGGVSPSTTPLPSTDARAVHNLTSQIVTTPRQIFAQEAQLAAVDTLTATLQQQIAETQKALAAFAARAPSSAARSQDDPSSPTTPPSIPPATTATTATTPITVDYSHLHGLTLQHQRETKQLTVKSAEYRSRIDALERQLSSTSSSLLSSRTARSADDAPDLTPALAAAAVQRSLDAKKRQVEALEGRIRQFHGLPPDIDVSRAEVRRAESDLDRLRRRRDELFEAL